MSSNSRPDRPAPARAAWLLVVLAASGALAAAASPHAAPAPAPVTSITPEAAAESAAVHRRPRHRIRPPAAPIGRAPGVAPPAPTAAEESLAFARNVVTDLRAQYGGDDNWALMDGLRYDVSYTIPGPGGTPVRKWTETHYVWLGGAPRVRIDTIEDSSIVVVSGDTTRVQKGGAWLGAGDPAIAAARSQALDVRWAWLLPRNLGDPSIRAQLLQPIVRDQPIALRYFYERPGLDRPEGTVLDVTFAPPTYAIRRLHWYDPRAKSWFALDLEGDRQRYDWTWAGSRTLHASNEAGDAGPVVWTAVIEDMQIESRMPLIVLSPPGAGPGVVTPAAPAAADSSRR